MLTEHHYSPWRWCLDQPVASFTTLKCGNKGMGYMGVEEPHQKNLAIAYSRGSSDTAIGYMASGKGQYQITWLPSFR